MEEQQIGWIAAIIIGGIAGWLAEQFMKSQMGLVMNIVLGIIGAAVASWLFGFLGITFGGWIGYLIAGFIGACILIAIARAFSGGLQQRIWEVQTVLSKCFGRTRRWCDRRRTTPFVRC
jgi:uncharacterized membrane protein YeaQ/YmgE (transglycosylase-associated protein family)